MRIRATLTAAVTAAALTTSLLGCAVSPQGTAARHRENVLRGFCSTAQAHTPYKRECVETADDDEGLLVIRDRAGKRHHMTGSVTALRWIKKHAPRCREEDSPRCWWDARTAGNGIGDSFIVIGGHREGQGTLWYLGDIA